MPISATELQALKPKKKPYKVSIGNGAYPLVTSAGKKYWRLKTQALAALLAVNTPIGKNSK